MKLRLGFFIRCPAFFLVGGKCIFYCVLFHLNYSYSSSRLVALLLHSSVFCILLYLTLKFSAVTPSAKQAKRSGGSIVNHTMKTAFDLSSSVSSPTIVIFFWKANLSISLLLFSVKENSTYNDMMLDITSPQECFPTDPNNPNQSRLELNLVSYTCGYTDTPLNENRTKFRRTGAYSESATLFFGTGEQAVYHLFSKHTHKQFSYAAMSTMLVIYFFMGCWSAGTSISSGLVVPMLLIGGLYGRMVGCLFVDKFGIQTNKYWKWLDPGAFALLGKSFILRKP